MDCNWKCVYLILALCFIKKEKNSRKENDTKENVAESEANEK